MIFLYSINSNRKFPLYDGLLYLEEFQVYGDGNDLPSTVYIEPPEFDGYVSGEDNDIGYEGGISDHVCPQQLKASCEVVMDRGERIGGQKNNDFALGL